jgi:hypothetical protein
MARHHSSFAAVIGAWLCIALGVTGAQAAGLGGSWSGQVAQSNPPATYPVEMQLSGETGRIDYASLGCGGTLEFLRTDGASHWYREHISYGKDKCIDAGVIEMRAHPPTDNASLDWTWSGGGVSVRGVLRSGGAGRK